DATVTGVQTCALPIYARREARGCRSPEECVRGERTAGVLCAWSGPDLGALSQHSTGRCAGAGAAARACGSAPAFWLSAAARPAWGRKGGGEGKRGGFG